MSFEKLAEAKVAYILLNWHENWDNTTLTIGELAHNLYGRNARIRQLKEQVSGLRRQLQKAEV